MEPELCRLPHLVRLEERRVTAERIPTDERRYSLDELKRLRRSMLLYARTFPPGSERNQHRQVAVSLRRLFKDAGWLAAHTI
jgi:hypothetical protein